MSCVKYFFFIGSLGSFHPSHAIYWIRSSYLLRFFQSVVDPFCWELVSFRATHTSQQVIIMKKAVTARRECTIN